MAAAPAPAPLLAPLRCSQGKERRRRQRRGSRLRVAIRSHRGHGWGPSTLHLLPAPAHPSGAGGDRIPETPPLLGPTGRPTDHTVCNCQTTEASRTTFVPKMTFPDEKEKVGLDGRRGTPSWRGRGCSLLTYVGVGRGACERGGGGTGSGGGSPSRVR